MKYLVNRETKEHLLYDSVSELFNINGWQIVEADSEGWIPWSGGECPLPMGCECEVIFSFQKNKSAAPENLRWSRDMGGAGGDITKYRPILTEQSEPEMPFGDKNLWIEESGQIEQSVFTRLASAVAASESIPALIAEVNAMLPEGYIVTKAESIIAQPVEDMSDWRNWREGDILECLDGNGWTLFKTGEKYPFDKEGDGKDGHIKLSYVTSFPADFRWHSRPTGASK